MYPVVFLSTTGLHGVPYLHTPKKILKSREEEKEKLLVWNYHYVSIIWEGRDTL